MTETALPSWFLALFAGAFVANALYLGSIFLTHRRMGSPGIRAKGYEPPALFGSNPFDGMRFLAFVFSGRHVEFGDAAASRLVWLTRVFFVVGGVLTISVFAQVLRLV